MNSADFVASVKKCVIDENLSIYKELFSAPPTNASDKYWQNSRALFNSLNEDQQRAFLQVIRQTMVDTISNLLGIIDGASFIEGVDQDFELTHGNNRNPLSGDLQSLFLASEEA